MFAPHVIDAKAWRFAALILPMLAAMPALADASDPWNRGTALFDEGKLLATGGVSAVEGEGGGGLAGWALISGYGTRDGIGIDAHDTYVGLPDYQLVSPGIAIGLFDRLELSYARAAFDTEA